jgi:hypothetical protein
MTQQIDGNLMTLFQQIFAAFCVFMTEICIFLSLYILASKSQQLLITPNATYTNQFQREFDSNVARATRDAFLASSPPRKKTNIFKLSHAAMLLSFADLLRC